jgi:hypothetical protein
MKCGAKAGLAVSGPTKSPGAVLGGAYEPTEPPAIRSSKCQGLGRLAAVKVTTQKYGEIA